VPDPIEPAAGTTVHAQISGHVVRVISEHTGRGPTKAWTSISGDLVSVVLRDTLTKGERKLVQADYAQLVLDTRKAYQDAMSTDLVEGIERILGRDVVAFLSANHIDPDVAIESFVLAPEAR
jgi:uncharacterized protein YbcI